MLMAKIFSDPLFASSLELPLAPAVAEPTVNPEDFTGAFKTLLEEIRSVKADLLVGEIATDAGYTIANNKVTSPNPFTATNIDKLTFRIMFRVPFYKSNWTEAGYGGYATYYGDPLDNSSSYGRNNDVQSWSYRANLYRSIANLGLNKLNSAGEEVDASGDPLNDFATKTAYELLSGIYPFISNQLWLGDGLAEYENKLFNSQDATPADMPDFNKIPLHFFRLAQDENPYIAFYKNQKYYKPHWPEINHANNRDKAPPHPYYERVIGITSPTGLTTAQKSSLNNLSIQSDATGPFVPPQVGTGTNANIRVELDYAGIDASARVSNDFVLAGCQFIYDSATDVSKARRPDTLGIAMKNNALANTPEGNKRYLVEKFTGNIGAASGLTIGAGIDLGAAFSHAYIKPCKWEISNITGVFKIRIGISASNVSTASVPNIRSAVETVLTAHFGDAEYVYLAEGEDPKITVTQNGDTYLVLIQTSHIWFEPNNLFISESTAQITDITEHRTDLSADYDFPAAFDYRSASAHKNTTSYDLGELVTQNNIIYRCIQANTGHPPTDATFWRTANNSIGDLVIYRDKVLKCTLNTAGEVPVLSTGSVNSGHWEETEARAQYKSTLDTLHEILIRSFSNTDPLTQASLTTALTTAGVSVGEQSNFMSLLKQSFSVRHKKLWVHFRNHYDLIRSFQLGTGDGYIQHLRAVFHEFFVPSYYRKAIVKLKSGNAPMKTEPNEIEKYVLASAFYNKGEGGFSRQISSLRHAINSHDYNKLITIVEGYWPAANNRRAVVKGFIENTIFTNATQPNNKVLEQLYRGVE